MNIFIKGKNQRLCVYVGNAPVVMKQADGNSDNQCEWLSLVEAMHYISANRNAAIEYFITMDSTLLYRQVTGEWRIRSKTLKPLYFKWNRMKNILMDTDIKYLHCEKGDNPARRYINVH